MHKRKAVVGVVIAVVLGITAGSWVVVSATDSPPQVNSEEPKRGEFPAYDHMKDTGFWPIAARDGSEKPDGYVSEADLRNPEIDRESVTVWSDVPSRGGRPVGTLGSTDRAGEEGPK
jgi:hypothetical protein